MAFMFDIYIYIYFDIYISIKLDYQLRKVDICPVAPDQKGRPRSITLW